MAFQRIRIKPSSNIAEVSWNEETKDLQVVFLRDARTYIFHEVGATAAYGFEKADSPGRYFNAYIRYAYLGEEI